MDSNIGTSLRFCIPIPHRPLGGMYSFLANLRVFLGGTGVTVIEDPEEDYDILLINSWVVPYRTVRRAKSRLPTLRVVHRLDGSARDYGRADDADSRQASVNLLADLSIFQSRYGRHATLEKFRTIGLDGPVIYNPVDVEVFRPDGPRVDLAGKARVAHVAFSTNPRKGAADLFAIAHSHPDIQFVLVGRYESVPPLPNLQLRGLLDRQDLAAALRGCDLFLFMAENEACPNVVLEALATGLPVLYRESGGTGEIVGDCGQAVTRETFRSALSSVLDRRTALAEAARERALRLFSPSVVFPQYLDAIARARRRPLPSLLDILRAHRRGYPVTQALPLYSAAEFVRGAAGRLLGRGGKVNRPT